jgi:hypothetical protein
VKGESQSLDGLTNQTKSIWFKSFVVLTVRNKDMRPIRKLEKWTSGGIGRISGHHPLLFGITICIHIESLLTIFRSVTSTLRKMEKYRMLEI